MATVLDTFITRFGFETDRSGLDRAEKGLANFKSSALKIAAAVGGILGGGLFLNSIANVADETLKWADANGIVIDGKTQGIQVTGNTVFNWGDQAPMLFGIIESESCRNNIIANNNINYFTEAGIQSAGENTQVENNLSEKDEAYQGMNRKGYPDYDRDRITQFIAQ